MHHGQDFRLSWVNPVAWIILSARSTCIHFSTRYCTCVSVQCKLKSYTQPTLQRLRLHQRKSFHLYRNVFFLVSIVEKGHWFQLILFHCFGPPMGLSGWMFVLSRKSLPIRPIATRAGFPCKLDRCLGTLSRGLGKFHHSSRRLAVAGHDILVSLLATTSPKKVGCSNNNED